MLTYFTPMTNTDNPQNPLDSFKHVVVLMLENRSFDNLLGYLYKPGEILPSFPLGQKFSGLNFDGPHTNPVPDDVKDGHRGENIAVRPVTPADHYFQPYPDPGEIYPHVNTQVFGTIRPESNKGSTDDKIIAPYNLPEVVPLNPPMNGFVKDYISVLRSLKNQGWFGRLLNWLGCNPKWFKLNDKYDDYKAIMECYEPAQVNVMATLAKEFAVFDHWHCDVPSQTYTNRAFWHSGTSYNFVNNSPSKKWILDQSGDTLFNRLQDKGIPWKIYTDNPISITGIIHFKQLLDYHFTHIKSFKHFLEDAENGALPDYTFIEPRFFTPHNDQHPSSYDSALYGAASTGSVLLGEKLIWQVYEAIRNSNSEKGNNWENTLLIITHDEHGGCYDHIPPPSAPSPNNPPLVGEDGFKFDRLGVRVPMIMVSAHIKPNTIVNNTYHHTSFLNTMCEKWGIDHFTERDKNAPKFYEVFTSPEVRDVKTWPIIPEPKLPDGWENIDFSDTPLNGLEKTILSALPHITDMDVEELKTIKTVGHAMNCLARYEGEIPGAKMEDLVYTL